MLNYTKHCKTIVQCLFCTCIGNHENDTPISAHALAQQQSHDPGDQSNQPNRSTIIERSSDTTRNDDYTVDSEGVRSVGGVGRSVSDHGLMKSKQQDGEWWEKVYYVHGMAHGELVNVYI